MVAYTGVCVADNGRRRPNQYATDAVTIVTANKVQATASRHANRPRAAREPNASDARTPFDEIGARIAAMSSRASAMSWSRCLRSLTRPWESERRTGGAVSTGKAAH